LRRAQLFETVDQPWMPESIRDSIVESLSRTLEWGRMLRGVVAPFRTFLERTGAREVLDIASGAGGPPLVLVRELIAAGVEPPRFLLTDLYPRVEAWQRAVLEQPDLLSFVPEPVDASAIPAGVAEGRARIVINAFHHFDPDLAQSVLDDAVRARAGVFVSEIFERNPLRAVSVAPVGIAAALTNPFVTAKQPIEKALLTWLVPAVIVAGAWDAVVSTLRSYSERELRAMAERTGGDFEWTYGTYTFEPFGRGYYFYGVPTRHR